MSAMDYLLAAGGLGNLVVSTAELGSSLLLPVLAVILAVVALVLLFRRVRRPAARAE